LFLLPFLTVSITAHTSSADGFLYLSIHGRCLVARDCKSPRSPDARSH
jgi:hypothetical protein